MTDKIKISTLTLFLIILVGCNINPERAEIVINEVVVENTDGYTNEFGERHGWIEIYNNTTRTIELSSIYITNDPSNPKKYAVPRGDNQTAVKPNQQVVFWADNKPTNGTFHLNFKLNPNEENYIGLFEADGETVIDELIIPAGMLPNQSYGYEEDGTQYDRNGNHLAMVLPNVTPNSKNLVEGENEKIVAMKKNDPWGGLMTLTSMFVVFSGLFLLYIAFNAIGNLSKWIARRQAVKSGKVIADEDTHELSGEVMAAISAAIYEMDQDIHDIESTILTIDEVKRTYSPWSSKIYGLRQLPKK